MTVGEREVRLPTQKKTALSRKDLEIRRRKRRKEASLPHVKDSQIARWARDHGRQMGARTIFFEMGGTSPMGAILSFDNLESIYVEPELKSAGTISISDCRRLLEETIH